MYVCLYECILQCANSVFGQPFMVIFVSFCFVTFAKQVSYSHDSCICLIKTKSLKIGDTKFHENPSNSCWVISSGEPMHLYGQWCCLQLSQNQKRKKDHDINTIYVLILKSYHSYPFSVSFNLQQDRKKASVGKYFLPCFS